MITAELLASNRPVVSLERTNLASTGAWARLQEAMFRGIIGGTASRADIRIDVFMAELESVREVRSVFGQEIQLGPELTKQLRQFISDRQKRLDALDDARPIDPGELELQLRASGFTGRKLKPFQLENLSTILKLPHAADFSVPGAGKTTVALANFSLQRAKGRVSRALVVAPIAAFSSWKEDSKICMDQAPRIVVHEGPESHIPHDTEILLTNYNRVASDYDRIRNYVASRPTQVILDEAHRIKRGAGGVHGRAVLDLAYAAARRDVLTGTPAPQGAHDLIALVRFLYPGQDHQILPQATYIERDGRELDVLRKTRDSLSRYFVRTPKSALHLPPTEFEVLRYPMAPIQAAIYEALIGRYRGQFQLQTSSRREFDRLGKIIMYLLEAATNPMLLVAGSDAADEHVFAHPPLKLRGDEPLQALLSSYNLHETPWKYLKVQEAVAQAAASGKKVLVWSNFVRNLKSLARVLRDFNPAVIHGGVPTEDGASPGAITREAEFARFKTDPRCVVLLANPAACGEGVSLHHWCHHAIYLDRTFNAGQFLQSQDRIHRLGLADDQVTRFTLLISEGTIDDSVDGRLREKVKALAILMNDPGLVQVALPEQDDGGTEEIVQDDDFSEVLRHIKSAGNL